MKITTDSEAINPTLEEHFKKVNGKNGTYLVKRVKSDLDKRLSRSEEQQLMESFNYENHKSNADRNKNIVILFLNTGLRVGEMAQICLFDIFEMGGELKKILTIRPEIAKRNKTRQIPINSAAKEAIRSLVGNSRINLSDALLQKNTGGPLSRRALQDIVKNSCLRAGIDRLIGPHVLRHTFLSKVYAKHKDVKITQQLAGHADPKLTMQLYTHTTMDAMIDALEDL